jgi:hypothetical protein
MKMYGAKVLILWRMTSRGVAYIYQRFGLASTGSTLKMVTARSFESLVLTYQSAQRDLRKPDFTSVAITSGPSRALVFVCVFVFGEGVSV